MHTGIPRKRITSENLFYNMKITLERRFELDEDFYPMDLSIPLSFGRSAFTAFGLPKAKHREFFRINEAGTQGCRCDEVTFCAHTHTTHIESCSHIQHSMISLNFGLLSLPPLLLALLIDVSQLACLDGEIERLRGAFPNVSPEAILLRTGATHHGANGTKVGFHVLSTGDVQVIVKTLPQIKVLLIDSVSIDPEHDGGSLSAHRAFFSEAQSRFIVELCYISPNINTGLYALAINAASFDSDAAPCRPVIYHLKNAKID